MGLFRKCSNEPGEALKSTLTELLKVAKGTLMRLDEMDDTLAKLSRRIRNVEKSIIGTISDSESIRITTENDTVQPENNSNRITS